MSIRFKHAVLGGTFDHFHIGHKSLLDEAFKKSELVIIGITISTLYRDKLFADQIESYEVRKTNVAHYLDEKGYTHSSNIISLSDIFGITLEDRDLDAIFVSGATQENAKLINQKRKEKSLPPLQICTIPLIYGDDGQVVSSQRIRMGQIDRNGNSYLDLFLKRKTYTLPESLRSTLQEPVDPIFISDTDAHHSLKKSHFVFSVGDIVTQKLLALNVSVAIGVIDFKTRRIHLQETIRVDRNDAKQIKNDAGTISAEFGSLYIQSLERYQENKKTQFIIVDGEEDLLALPMQLLCPLGSKVVYGQYEKGMVVVTITEEKKRYIKELLERFA